MSPRRRPLPKRPFRDSAIFYAIVAAISLVLVWATGGRVLPRFGSGHNEVGALPIVIAVYLLATGYAWWRFKQRIEAAEEEEKAAGP